MCNLVGFCLLSNCHNDDNLILHNLPRELKGKNICMCTSVTDIVTNDGQWYNIWKIPVSIARLHILFWKYAKNKFSESVKL